MLKSTDSQLPPSQSGEPLTDREYWDSIYRAAPGGSEDGVTDFLGERSWLRRASARGKSILRVPDWFWGELLPQFIRKDVHTTVLEIGAAPGDDVLMFQKRFGLEPFGLEYSPAGVAATRRNFERHMVSADHVIMGDLFDASVTARYESRFDIVFSRGFIEHFRDPTEAIEQHVRLTKEGGLVVITIPTLTGVHYLVTRGMMPHQIAMHNRDIMHRAAFARLFQDSELEMLYCGYGGGLNLLIAYDVHPTGIRRLAQHMLLKLQLVANLCGRKGLCRGRYLNGTLVFIGQKRLRTN
jgi:SAM-dependent methyltransferase